MLVNVGTVVTMGLSVFQWCRAEVMPVGFKRTAVSGERQRTGSVVCLGINLTKDKTELCERKEEKKIRGKMFEACGE